MSLLKNSVKNSEKWQGSPESIAYRPGAGVFLMLLAVATVAVFFFGFFFWYVPTIGLKNIHPALPYITGALFITTAIFIIGGTAVITAAAVKGRLFFYSPLLRWFLVKVFLPLMVMAGGILRVPKIKIERIFIDINNQMVLMMKKKGRLIPKKLLMLMPHCIQFDNCKIKVTRNVKNCAGCGKCEIGELLALTERFGVDLFISTGGTVARRKVHEDRPDAVQSASDLSPTRVILGIPTQEPVEEPAIRTAERCAASRAKSGSGTAK
jgi:hypothetical protein